MENTNMKTLLQMLAESFAQNSAVKKVYGEPVNTQGKTIITVAKISQGFGGGFGEKNGRTEAPSETAPVGSKPAKNGKSGEGGGMGGGMTVTPVGFIEVTADRTRFIRFDTSRYIVLGAALGFAISAFWYRGNFRLKPNKKGKKQKK